MTGRATMLRYDLAAMVPPKRRRGQKALPPIDVPLNVEIEYRRALTGYLDRLQQVALTNTLPAAMARMSDGALVIDADESVMAEFEATRRSLLETVKDMVRRILWLETDRHTRKWAAAVKKALGVDIAAIIRAEDLQGPLGRMTDWSVSLITNLSDEVRSKVASAVQSAMVQGQDRNSLATALRNVFEVSKRRAALIARDQLAKANSLFNQFRHQQAGIEEYSWSTSADERVRPLHRSLEGNVYRYGEKTGAEEGLPPGQPINCRCVALAIVKF